MPPRRSVLDAVVDWCLLGPALQAGGLGLAAFAVARGVGAATGSGPATAQILAGVFWRKGVLGTLLSLLAARTVAASGQRRRHPTPEELEWAETTVFLGTLPPRERIVITDTIGMQGRAFTFPEPGGTIAVHLGPAGFADALSQPALFVHELTHVWQLEHAPLESAWLVRAIAAQAVDAVTHRAYVVPQGRPFPRLNPEQQATLVEQWFARGCERDDTAYPAVRDHVQGARSRRR